MTDIEKFVVGFSDYLAAWLARAKEAGQARPATTGDEAKGGCA